MSHELDAMNATIHGLQQNLDACEQARAAAIEERNRYRDTAHDQEKTVADLHKLLADGATLTEDLRSELEQMKIHHADTAEFRTRIEALEVMLKERSEQAKELEKAAVVERDARLAAEARVEFGAMPLGSATMAIAVLLNRARLAILKAADVNPDVPFADAVAACPPWTGEAFSAIRLAARYLPVPDGDMNATPELAEALGAFADSQAKDRIAELEQRCRELENRSLAAPFSHATLPPSDPRVEPIARGLEMERAKVDALLMAIERMALGYGNAGRL